MRHVYFRVHVVVVGAPGALVSVLKPPVWQRTRLCILHGHTRLGTSRTMDVRRGRGYAEERRRGRERGGRRLCLAVADCCTCWTRVVPTRVCRCLTASSAAILWLTRLSSSASNGGCFDASTHSFTSLMSVVHDMKTVVSCKESIRFLTPSVYWMGALGGTLFSNYLLLSPAILLALRHCRRAASLCHGGSTAKGVVLLLLAEHPACREGERLA